MQVFVSGTFAWLRRFHSAYVSSIVDETFETQNIVTEFRCDGNSCDYLSGSDFEIKIDFLFGTEIYWCASCADDEITRIYFSAKNFGVETESQNLALRLPEPKP